MPSPSSFDPWLASRRFGIVIDAGSSGSRLQIYSWKDARVDRYEEGQNSLPKVEKGTKTGEDWVSKVEPGISTFAENPQDVGPYLAPLLAHAQNYIPPSLQTETPLVLLATAGMRLLAERQQYAILEAACNFLRFHSHFKLDPQSSNAPCGSSIRVISGEEEGLFGWIAVNYLMDGFSHAADPVDDRATYGFLDMGGASTQIAFEPSKVERERHPNNLVEVRLRLLGGQEIHHQVFVTTWLGYGTNQARERYVGQAVARSEAHGTSDNEGETELVPDPCLPVGLTRTEQLVQTGSATSHSRTSHTLLGTGSFERCLKDTAPLLNKNAPCLDAPCLFNGVHVPPINFSISHFIGVSEYWYSSEHVFGLGGAYDVVQYERAASEFCSREWTDLVHEHETSRTQGHLGGDGEVEQDGRIIETGKWGKDVELSRLEMQCFKAAWIVNVLHEGIGLPRIVDPGGNHTSHDGGVKMDKMAHRKGLGRPAFQSMDTVGDTAISWTLGKMVLEASKEVPASSEVSPPLRDPLDTTASQEIDDPILPSRPPFLDFDKFEDRISHRLPSSLTRHALGVSPFFILFYFFIFSIFLFLIYRLRHRLRTALRRLRRGSFKRERAEVLFDMYSHEENKIGSSTSSHTTPFSSAPSSPTGTGPQTHRLIAHVSLSLRRILSTIRGQTHPHSSSPVPIPPPLRHLHFSPGRLSPRATASSAFPQPNGTANGFHPAMSRSDPTAPMDESPALSTFALNPAHPLGALAQSRSRNSSQMNLTTLVPRTTSYSRTTAG